MAKQSSDSSSRMIISLVIIGVILVLGVVGYFVYKNFSVQVNIEVKPSSESNHQNYTVEIINKAYLPNVLEINMSDTIIWINKDSTIIHTITSDNYLPLRSSTLKSDDSFTLTFNESGTYSYHCAFHPSEKGTITVN